MSLFGDELPKTTHMRLLSSRGEPAIPAGTFVEFCASWERHDSASQSPHAPKRGQVWSAAPGARTLWVVLPEQSCIRVRAAECTIMGDGEQSTLRTVGR